MTYPMLKWRNLHNPKSRSTEARRRDFIFVTAFQSGWTTAPTRRTRSPTAAAWRPARTTPLQPGASTSWGRGGALPAAPSTPSPPSCRPTCSRTPPGPGSTSDGWAGHVSHSIDIETCLLWQENLSDEEIALNKELFNEIIANEFPQDDMTDKAFRDKVRSKSVVC